MTIEDLDSKICGKLDCIVKVIPIILRFMCIRTECENFTAQFVISSQYGFPRQLLYGYRFCHLRRISRKIQ